MTGSRLLAKAGAMHHENMLLQAEFFNENVVSFWNIEPREGIERAARRHTTHAGRGVRPFHGDIAAGMEFAADFD